MVFRGGRRGRGRRGRGRGKEREGGSVVARRVSRGNYGRLTANQGGRGGVVIRILQSLWGIKWILLWHNKNPPLQVEELSCSMLVLVLYLFYLTFWFESCSRHISALDRFDFLNTSKSCLCQNLENKLKWNNISSNSINYLNEYYY